MVDSAESSSGPAPTAYSAMMHIEPKTGPFFDYVLGLRPFSPDDIEAQIAKYKKADAFFSSPGVAGIDPTALDGESASSEMAATTKKKPKKKGVKEILEELRAENAQLIAQLEGSNQRVAELEYELRKSDERNEELETQVANGKGRIDALCSDVTRLSERDKLSRDEADKLHAKLRDVMKRELQKKSAFGGPLPEIYFGPKHKKRKKLRHPAGTTLSATGMTGAAGVIGPAHALQRLNLQASLSEAKLLRQTKAEAMETEQQMRWFEQQHQSKQVKVKLKALQHTPIKVPGRQHHMPNFGISDNRRNLFAA